MSESMIFANDLALKFAIVRLIALSFVAIGTIIILCIKAHNRKKIKQYEDEIDALNIKCYDKTKEMHPFLDSEVEGQKEKREEIQAQRDKEVKEKEESKAEYKERNNLLDCVYSAVMIIGWGIWLIMLLASAFVSLHYGGNVSSPKSIDNVATEDVAAVMYYEVSYNDIEQSTLTVFIKNNSKKPLKEATIVEKNSGAETKIVNLDYGQEKLVSFSVYSDDDNYEFEVKNVVFYE